MMDERAIAESMLNMWGGVYSSRDYIVLRAHYAGISRVDIHKATGLALTTVDRIIKKA